MHDIDRTQLEQSTPPWAETASPAEYGEYESPGPAGEAPSPLTEAQEVELASELLEVTSEQELDHFLGNVISTVGRAAGRFIRSDTGRALGGLLKGAARKALPAIGQAVGQWISPGRGGAIGADLAARAGRIFGLELEGLSQEDREFEAARQFARFAAASASQAGLAPPSMPAIAAARHAVVTAARTHAPGLFPRLQGRSSTLWPRTGRWVRRGRAIMLYGG